jgi:Zn ribbon nucleic-acid-binding protein
MVSPAEEKHADGAFPPQEKAKDMTSDLLEKMGGERFCSICGYVEREVYRLFCPHCMQRDRLAALVSRDESHETVPCPMEPSSRNSFQGLSM